MEVWCTNFWLVRGSPLEVLRKSTDPGVQKYSFLPKFQGFRVAYCLYLRAVLREVQWESKRSLEVRCGGFARVICHSVLPHSRGCSSPTPRVCCAAVHCHCDPLRSTASHCEQGRIWAHVAQVMVLRSWSGQAWPGLGWTGLLGPDTQPYRIEIEGPEIFPKILKIFRKYFPNFNLYYRRENALGTLTSDSPDRQATVFTPFAFAIENWFTFNAGDFFWGRGRVFFSFRNETPGQLVVIRKCTELRDESYRGGRCRWGGGSRIGRGEGTSVDEEVG